MGDVVSASGPLVRLDELARHDRHRVVLPVLTRAGDTWLGTPDGVVCEVQKFNLNPKPGDVVVEWLISPPSAAASVSPGGDVILTLSEEDAMHKRSAIDELRAMHEAVEKATRQIEVDVLGIVTPGQITELDRLRQATEAAREATYALIDSTHVIDAQYLAREKQLNAELCKADNAERDLYRQLFD